MIKFIDLTGQIINDWTIIKRESSLYGKARWLCQCKCGEYQINWGGNLRRNIGKCCFKCSYKNRPGIRQKPFYARYTFLKRGGIKRHIQCSLTYAEFIEFTKIDKCHYCDDIIKWHPYTTKIKGKNNGYNLDRKDNTLGYTKDNCVVCCKICNAIKQDIVSYSTMLKFGKILKEEKEANGSSITK